MLSTGSRVFVGIVFGILGLSFIATSAVMIYEYREADWFSIATFYSHIYVFYATFGLVALAAFYIPACVFTDMYWKHVYKGRLRFLIGFAIIAAASWVMSQALSSGNERTFWELTPQAVRSDTGDTVACGTAEDPRLCRRIPVLRALSEAREISQSRIGLAPFGRSCTPDPLVEPPAELAAKRWCFVTRTMETGPACCRVQANFAAHMTRTYVTPENRSLTGYVMEWLLPFKVFFLFVLLVVGLLLAIRRKGVDKHYGAISHRIESGVLTGAAVMLFWPVMNHAYLQSAAVLYGTDGESLFRLLGSGFSILFGGWALLLLFYFHRRYEKSMEAVGKIAGLIASALAVLQYDNIVNYAVYITGSGANHFTVAIMLLLGVVALIQLIVRMSSSDGSAFGEDAMPENLSGHSSGAASASSATTSAMKQEGVTSLSAK